MSRETLCPVCEQGILAPEQDQNPVTYKGITKVLPMRLSVCSCCGSETATTADLRENKRIANEFKKKVDGLLTGCELRHLRTEQWCISQDMASKIFGGGPKAFSKYESDDVVQSEAMDKLLRIAASVPEVLDVLKTMSGIEIMVEKQIVVSAKTSQWSETINDIESTQTTSISSSSHHKEFLYNDTKHWRVREVA
ncbi:MULTISPECIES: type II toxin-antitoxin system MqsA family antitoxin [Pantoea]|jgi:HTH-type transcriptional regulator/antitoxin MqsA|uniref:type II toxin-antitoxin system MqsA family antitoxin n=1 Tax=Pantoea TaxID=53335 RepID=UPI0015FD4F6A|nr:type II toxin-antitoxin system MqsA family antitoxin [Pantoea agglomerans]MBA8870139.1 HTH-type transcriptional regulator/antitoxin MqsA [Pantoea agglomerans]MBA8874518.1 HTH-type transcriptional regulator/antitoxin MqsA [Pantoea agglomerans]MBD8262657.1 type II toxin-antitoxin system MqsA family antitoxin [Pantoea agglomerans]